MCGKFQSLPMLPFFAGYSTPCSSTMYIVWQLEAVTMERLVMLSTTAFPHFVIVPPSPPEFVTVVGGAGGGAVRARLVFDWMMTEPIKLSTHSKRLPINGAKCSESPGSQNRHSATFLPSPSPLAGEEKEENLSGTTQHDGHCLFFQRIPRAQLQ